MEDIRDIMFRHLEIAHGSEDPLGYSDVECPDCGSRAKDLGLLMTTALMWTPGHYDERGFWVPHKNPNKTTREFYCRKCGKDYSITY